MFKKKNPNATPPNTNSGTMSPFGKALIIPLKKPPDDCSDMCISLYDWRAIGILAKTAIKTPKKRRTSGTKQMFCCLTGAAEACQVL